VTKSKGTATPQNDAASKPQEVQYGKYPATDTPVVQFGKYPATSGRVVTTPQNSPQNVGIVPTYAGGDPTPPRKEPDN